VSEAPFACLPALFSQIITSPSSNLVCREEKPFHIAHSIPQGLLLPAFIAAHDNDAMPVAEFAFLTHIATFI